MSTLIVLGILIAIVILIIRKLLNDHKKGISVQCGHACSECGGSCHATSALADYRKDHPKVAVHKH